MTATLQGSLATAPLDLRRDFGQSRERMARPFDVTAKTIERWEEQGRLPDRASTRIRAEFARLQEIRNLGLRVYTPDGFRLFLRTPLPELGSRTPWQAIEQGDEDLVFGALASDFEGLGY